MPSAGRHAAVFDPGNNKPRWAADLTYPVRDLRTRHSARERPGSAHTCCLETNDRLFIWDTGFLTAFALATGKTLWRLPSVGISGVQQDRDGMLYVCTANLSPESLKYSLQVNLTDAVDPLILKVDPKDGKVFWKAPKFENCIVSGKHLYATRYPIDPMDMVNGVFGHGGTPERFLLFKLDQKTGKIVWQHFEPRTPSAIHAAERDLLMEYRNGVNLLSSWAF